MTAFDNYKSLLKDTVIRGNVTKEESTNRKASILGLIKDFCPQKLFRYRTCNEYNFDALLNDRIYFNAPIYFNDPHDCLAYIDMEKVYSLLNQIGSVDSINMLVYLRNGGKVNSDSFSPNEEPLIQSAKNMFQNVGDTEFDLLGEFIKSLDSSCFDRVKKELSSFIQENHSANLKLAREETFIACLSETFDSTLMWAHYADYHKGFVLEYDTSDLVKVIGRCINCQEPCASEHTVNLYPIIYEDERYDATAYEIETLTWRAGHCFFGLSEPFCLPDQLFYIKSNTYKGLDWEYEKEWRLIYTCRQGHPAKKYEVVKPKAIYFGSQISESNKRIILKLIDGKEIPIYEMYADDSNKQYALSFRPVEAVTQKEQK